VTRLVDTGSNFAGVSGTISPEFFRLVVMAVLAGEASSGFKQSRGGRTQDAAEK
jgi:hypothetical protein